MAGPLFWKKKCLGVGFEGPFLPPQFHLLVPALHTHTHVQSPYTHRVRIHIHTQIRSVYTIATQMRMHTHARRHTHTRYTPDKRQSASAREDKGHSTEWHHRSKQTDIGLTLYYTSGPTPRGAGPRTKHYHKHGPGHALPGS